MNRDIKFRVWDKENKVIIKNELYLLTIICIVLIKINKRVEKRINNNRLLTITLNWQ